MTALTMPARPVEDDARPAAGAVAADGRGHLAAAPLRAGRRGRAARRAGGVPVDRRPSSCTTPTPPRSPATRQARRLRRTLVNTFNGMDDLPGERRHPAGAAGADRGVRRGAVAGQGDGDRHLPVRLDPGLRPVALDARQAGDARGRGDGRRRAPSALLLSWYYQPYFATGNQALALPRRPRSTPACSTCAGSRSPPGRWPPSRSAPWPGCSSAGSSPRSPPPWPSTPGSPSPPGCTCASTT